MKKGSVTYQQARNIARAGNIDSLVYDAKNNAVTSGYAFAIGFTITFARALWEGKTTKEALRESVGMGLLAAGTSFIAGVATSQLLRTSMVRKATVFVRAGVKAVASTDWGRIAVDKIASAAAGKSLSGAAATNYVSKLCRTNVITGVVTTIVITGPDIYRAAINRSVSWKQVGKNLVVNGVGVTGGTVGWAAGAAAGAAVGTAFAPGVGTVIGSAVGAVAGSVGAGAGSAYLAKKATDYVVEDDTEALVRILEDVLPMLADEYLMTQSEFDLLLEQVGKDCTVPFFREMHAQDARDLFVRVCFEPYCEAIIRQREPIVAPTEDEVQGMLDNVLAAVSPDETDDDMTSSNYVPNFVFPAAQQDADLAAAISGFFFWPRKRA